MSEQENKKLVVEQLKKLNSNFNTFNKIMSSFLVIATTESTFKNKTKKEIKEQLVIKNKIDSTKLVLELANNKTFSTLNKEQTKKVMPQFNETLKHINENIYGK